MNFFTSTKEEYIEFFARIFDPYLIGEISKADYDKSMDCIFNDQFSEGFENEQTSLSSDVKRLFLDNNIVDVNSGVLNMEKLRRGFYEGIIDIEIFKQALK